GQDGRQRAAADRPDGGRGQRTLRTRCRAANSTPASPATPRTSTHAGGPGSYGAPDGAPPGTPDGELCRFETVKLTRPRLLSCSDPMACTKVAVPSLRSTSAGPITGSVLPAAATAADTEPAGTVSTSSFGFVSPWITGLPPASTSTAGAAAVCRTTSRACPAATLATSFLNGVTVGLPSASRCATSATLAPSGRSASADSSGEPEPSAASAGKIATLCGPAGR